MKENCIVMHIPHASTYIPPEYLPYFNPTKVTHELLVMTDHYCDELFDAGCEKIVTPLSRLVCDVERFRDDEQEIMSRIGMGLYYTRCSDGSPLREANIERRKRILQQYYDPHHKALGEAAQEKLDHFGHCLIIDGHSFHPTPLPYEMDQADDRPDFCLGTDDFHTPPELTEKLKGLLEAEGYSVKINSPFRGTIVPMAFYGQDRRVSSIMIEINRRLYMDELWRKTDGFERVKNTIGSIVEFIESAKA